MSRKSKNAEKKKKVLLDNLKLVLFNPGRLPAQAGLMVGQRSLEPSILV